MALVCVPHEEIPRVARIKGYFDILRNWSAALIPIPTTRGAVLEHAVKLVAAVLVGAVGLRLATPYAARLRCRDNRRNASHT